MNKKLSTQILTAIMIITFLTLSGCGNGSASDRQYDAGGSADLNVSQKSEITGETYDVEATDDAMPEDTSQSITMDKKNAAADASGSEEGASLNGTVANTKNTQSEKLIFTYNYSVETTEFDSFYEKISKKLSQIGGYVENSETDGSASDGSNRYASLTLRVPANQMNQIITLLDSESNITYQSQTSENVTLQYVDMQSHLKALRTEQETLLQLMEKADKLKDVIELQSQLTQVRYEIESYESRLRMYDNLVEYSTLHLNISEVQRTTNLPSSKTSFMEEAGNKLSDNLYALKQGLRAFAIWFISSLPVLIPIAIILAAAILIRTRKKRSRSLENPESQDQDSDTSTQ